jgi:predicted negative regulator of RcsB-dependent stress response
VDDYLSERDQWDALKGWLRENGAWMVAGVIIGVAGLFGYRWWEERQIEQAHTAQARYTEVLSALGRNDRTRATELADELKRDFARTPYSDQAQLALARAHVESLEFDAAIQRLREVMEGSKDDELRLIARERIARVQLAQDRPDEALATLAAADSPGVFSARYAEVRGDALLRKGDTAGAIAAYREALASTEPGVVDMGQLQLKLNDLGAGETPPDEAEEEAGAEAAPEEATQ